MRSRYCSRVESGWLTSTAGQQAKQVTCVGEVVGLCMCQVALLRSGLGGGRGGGAQPPTTNPPIHPSSIQYITLTYAHYAHDSRTGTITAIVDRGAGSGRTLRVTHSLVLSSIVGRISLLDSCDDHCKSWVFMLKHLLHNKCTMLGGYCRHPPSCAILRTTTTHRPESRGFTLRHLIRPYSRFLSVESQQARPPLSNHRLRYGFLWNSASASLCRAHSLIIMGS